MIRRPAVGLRPTPRNAAGSPIRLEEDSREMTAGRSLYPETGYAKLGADRVADQTVGVGPPDLVLTWGASATRTWLGRVGCRPLLLPPCLDLSPDPLRPQRHGWPNRIPLEALPPWESYVEELIAVRDAVGSEHAALVGGFDGDPMSANE